MQLAERVREQDAGGTKAIPRVKAMPPDGVRSKALQ
jgi:hypothetical protein